MREGELECRELGYPRVIGLNFFQYTRLVEANCPTSLPTYRSAK